MAVALVAGAPAGCAHRPSYEWSPQWRHGHFANPPEWDNRRGGLREVARWILGKRPESQPFSPPRVPNDGAALRANTAGYSVTWIGHATTLVQTGGVDVLTDPFFSRCVAGVICRRGPPGVALSDLPRVDVVLISHNHVDHLDAPSLRALGPHVRYLVPLGVAPWFRAHGLPQVVELDWWQSTTVETARGDATFTMVPAQHWSRRSVHDQFASLWGGWIIDGGGYRTYFAGDTGYPAAFREVGRRFPGIDLALLPIGAYEPRWFMHAQHMTPAEAALAFGELGARRLIGIHWGTFRLSDEPMDEPPRLLEQALGERAQCIAAIAQGQTFFLPAPSLGAR